ncbi:hypothetical protein RHMOL_Rhmol03G0056200 [Rhododendron molle]|uniref:Uncharacterized protein n=1 Tax=Rhododendron molle TaxID=49168 RepID=A0ACC0PAZ1_RHOML|nr:hypothetical protein RHMOL_Rhmol03G0056200 [Rhododendron molle]
MEGSKEAFESVGKIGETQLIFGVLLHTHDEEVNLCSEIYLVECSIGMFTTVLYRCMSRSKVVVHGISLGDNNNIPSRAYIQFAPPALAPGPLHVRAVSLAYPICILEENINKKMGHGQRRVYVPDVQDTSGREASAVASRSFISAINNSWTTEITQTALRKARLQRLREALLDDQPYLENCIAQGMIINE